MGLETTCSLRDSILKSLNIDDKMVDLDDSEDFVLLVRDTVISRSRDIPAVLIFQSLHNELA